MTMSRTFFLPSSSRVLVGAFGADGDDWHLDAVHHDHLDRAGVDGRGGAHLGACVAGGAQDDCAGDEDDFHVFQYVHDVSPSVVDLASMTTLKTNPPPNDRGLRRNAA